MIIDLAVILIIIRAVLSWVNPDPNNPIVQFLRASTDPMMRPIQRFIPPIGGGIDISPIVLLFGLYFLRYALVESLIGYARVLNPTIGFG
ncbi:MAG: YggT family protein [Bdellovibrionales bacterium]|nr:YggT family protein [Bdellovibrionales bacterium]